MLWMLLVRDEDEERMAPPPPRRADVRSGKDEIRPAELSAIST